MDAAGVPALLATVSLDMYMIIVLHLYILNMYEDIKTVWLHYVL